MGKADNRSSSSAWIVDKPNSIWWCHYSQYVSMIDYSDTSPNCPFDEWQEYAQVILIIMTIIHRKIKNIYISQKEVTITINLRFYYYQERIICKSCFHNINILYNNIWANYLLLLLLHSKIFEGRSDTIKELYNIVDVIFLRDVLNLY